MTTPLLHWPEPRTDLPRPAGARPLAGSAHVWFDRVRAMDAARAPVDAAPGTADRLAAPRPVLPGLPTDRPLVMGIVNVTPDSFSDGGEAFSRAAAVARARAMIAAGADILDIGGESTRPGADDVPEAEEIARTAPVIAELRAAGATTPISIDTRKAAVAAAALREGADIVNDVAALTHDPDLGPLVAEAGVALCLMHAQGTPRTMQQNPRYDDVLVEVHLWLADRLAAARAQGIDAARLIVDPGIGFGKTGAHNLTLLQGLALIHDLGAPVLLGASRKRFIGTLSGVEAAGARLAGSLAAALHAAGQGAHVLRVHDVGETVQALAVWRALTTEAA